MPRADIMTFRGTTLSGLFDDALPEFNQGYYNAQNTSLISKGIQTATGNTRPTPKPNTGKVNNPSNIIGGAKDKVIAANPAIVSPDAVGRGDVISFYFETTYLNPATYQAGSNLTRLEAFKTLLTQNGWTQVRVGLDAGYFWDAIRGQATCNSGGFGEVHDAAQAIAGLAYAAGIGVAYSNKSPVAEIISKAGSGYKPPSVIPPAPENNSGGGLLDKASGFLGVGGNTIAIGAAAAIIFVLIRPRNN